MGISIFPSTAAEFVSNNFVVDMNDTTNNSVTLTNTKQAGTYNITLESGDTTFDIYFLDADGASVAYTNTTSITVNDTFDTVVILGVATDEIITFAYAGTVFDTTGEGNEPGAGAYLTSISPADLPSIDDTATVIGGNFGTATEISFTSGTVELAAKNVTITNGTSLIVTRPDGLIEDDAPYDLKAINTGVTPPTGTNAHILAGTVTAGSDPTWVTTSPLNIAAVGSSFTQTLEATDSEGTVTDYSVTAGTITPGLSLNSSTGVLSGTPTTAGNYTFTVTATDDGGNETAKEFEQLAGSGVSGGSTFSSGGFEYNLFTSTDDLIVFEETTIEYLIVAGGGGGGSTPSNPYGAGGGGAGGLLSGTATLTPQSLAVTIGAGGAATTAGNDSVLETLGTAIGGGDGGDQSANGNDGGSGGGAGGAPSTALSGGTGTAGQGNNGGSSPNENNSDYVAAGGGGGATQNGGNASNSGAFGGDGGDGSNAFATWATAVNLVIDGGYFAGGGGGGGNSSAFGGGAAGDGGLGGGGNGAGQVNQDGFDATANSGGGGGGSFGDTAFPNRNSTEGGLGGSGVVIVRYAS